MSKTAWGIVSSTAFAIALTFTPLPQQWKPIVITAAWAVVLAAGIGWFYARPSTPRGDLLLTVLHFDYDNSSQKLIADLKFYNDDTLERMVLAVSFLYRSDNVQTSYEMYSSGPNDVPFVGHIEPIKVAPKTSETHRYVSERKIAPEHFGVIGAHAGLLITFTVPGRDDDTATVIPTMEIQKTGDLVTPSRMLPHIKNLSVDSIGESKRLNALVGEMTQQQQPKVFSKLLCFFDY